MNMERPTKDENTLHPQIILRHALLTEICHFNKKVERLSSDGGKLYIYI